MQSSDISASAIDTSMLYYMLRGSVHLYKIIERIITCKPTTARYIPPLTDTPNTHAQISNASSQTKVNLGGWGFGDDLGFGHIGLCQLRSTVLYAVDKGLCGRNVLHQLLVILLCICSCSVRPISLQYTEWTETQFKISTVESSQTP